MENEIKIAIVIDNYKLSKLEEWWNKCMKKKRFLELYPNMDKYELKKTEQKRGPLENVTSVIRTYKLKEVKSERKNNAD